MKPAPREDFFDVLLDRLVKDVASDLAKRFNLEPADAAPGDRGSERARAYELDATDLAARVLDWRVRSQSAFESPSGLAQIRTALTPPRIREVESFEVGASAAERAHLEEQKASQDPWIALRSPRALLSLRILEREGLAFTAQERIIHESHVSVQERALRRERRRVLMHLHPDRRESQTMSEQDRRRIHEQFLAAYEAFETIFAELEDITKSSQDRREHASRPARAA